jgi:hypothetical protein
LGEGGLNVSDEELVKQSLIAWRHHLRTQNRYKPDKNLPKDVHETHVKILMAALSSFKKERVRHRLSKKGVLMYQHEQYSYMYKEYNVPKEACYPYELMSKVDADRDILYRKRCAPLYAFYSMIMEDTPGYIPSGHWSKPPLEGSSRSSSRSSDRGASASRSGERDNRRSNESPEYHVKSPSRKESRDSKESSVVKENVVWGSTEHLSARRYKDKQRGPRHNPIVGEEKGHSDESGNDTDHDNCFYDHRLLPADKRKLADLLWKIKRIKQSDLPRQFLEGRTEWLNNAEKERVERGIVPPCLYDVEPPWDNGKGLSLLRYNEMIVRNLEFKITKLREENAASCAKYDAENKKHGPRDGHGRR